MKNSRGAADKIGRLTAMENLAVKAQSGQPLSALEQECVKPAVKRLDVGQRVKVIALSDETSNPEYLGQTGVIEELYPTGAGVGESQGDPFIRVRLDGSNKPDGFWTEELEAI